MIRPRHISEEAFTAMVNKVRGGTVRRVSAKGEAASAVDPTGVGRALTPARKAEDKPIRQGAGLNPAPSLFSPYANKWEWNYSRVLDGEQRVGAIKGWLYEPFSFKLAMGKRYRVDFVTWGPQGIECIEVKGHWIPNRRDGLTHLAWAAQRFPFFTWRMVWMKKGGGWDGKYVDI